MDAKGWFSGDDTRELSAPPEEEDICPSCGAGPDDVCAWSCECDYCIRQRERQADPAEGVLFKRGA